ncbi:hypothetical protein CLAFUW4_03812 [Fulvia fulva]|uniref:Uncharacterized protein n=1 Tax=Passalora fulva TaxID=5499 RepID=A0A9Q8L9P1_PASFU|nr:uncharacterized protein CLAFUR5_03784 [Fulvia fulva]KAK4633587.1 hypothetical protein CLAFUR0_03799 [Fulvia fulva]UJO13384.1 hypothetical protein CLAFUR5_03784 [Fulvia fulva]WPV11127.1 hypothetical protein CLAFUW4_03812 [Fulvia fulva]
MSLNDQQKIKEKAESSSLFRFSHPSEASSRSHQRTIQSHATQHKHRERRKQAGRKVEAVAKKPAKRLRTARPYQVLRTKVDTVGAPLANDDPISREFTAPSSSGEQAAPGTAGQRLEFVTCSDPDQLKSPSIRKKVRVQAGKSSHPSALRARQADDTLELSHKDQDREGHAASIDDFHFLDAELQRFFSAWPGLQKSSTFGVSQDTYGLAIAQSSQYVSDLVLRDQNYRIEEVLGRLGCTIELAMDHFLLIVFSQPPGLEANYK